MRGARLQAFFEGHSGSLCVELIDVSGVHGDELVGTHDVSVKKYVGFD